MFLQPDWFEVLRPGVGTNRFSYSFNRPVNFSDPSGHAAVYRDGNYVGQINPGDPGYESATGNRRFSAPLPSEWVAATAAYRSGTVTASERPGSLKIGSRTAVTALLFQNGAYVKRNIHHLLDIFFDGGFEEFAVRALIASNYLSCNPNVIREVAGNNYLNANGTVRYKLYPIHLLATQKTTPIPVPTPLRNETGVFFHTHPFDGGHPSSADISGPVQYPYAGLVVTYNGKVWGYDEGGYRD